MKSQFRHFEPISVRWGDMDAMGHVNNAAYFTYCESARMSYFQEIRMDQLRQEVHHGPAVVTATCNFHRQLHYPAEIEVGARASKIGSTSFTLEYAIYRRGTEELIADGSSVIVWVDYDQGKAIAVPEALVKAIEACEGTS